MAKISRRGEIKFLDSGLRLQTSVYGENIMTNLDEDIENNGDENNSSGSKINKKILFIVVPILIIIAATISFFTIFNHSETTNDIAYNVVKKPISDDGKKQETIVFYDLPEIVVQIKDNDGDSSNLKIKLNMEISNPNDIKMVDAFVPRIVDIIITHTIELNTSEVNGVGNLYWLKEELLKRVNLVTDPVKINNLNFKVFEIVKN